MVFKLKNGNWKYSLKLNIYFNSKYIKKIYKSVSLIELSDNKYIHSYVCKKELNKSSIVELIISVENFFYRNFVYFSHLKEHYRTIVIKN